VCVCATLPVRLAACNSKTMSPCVRHRALLLRLFFFVSLLLLVRGELTNTSLSVRSVIGFAPPLADASGRASPLYKPVSVALDSEGYVLVLEAGNSRIRRIDPNSDYSYTYAGSPQPSAMPIDGVGTTARFVAPFLMALAGNDLVYVVDGERYDVVLRVIVPTVDDSGKRVGASTTRQLPGWTLADQADTIGFAASHQKAATLYSIDYKGTCSIGRVGTDDVQWQQLFTLSGFDVVDFVVDAADNMYFLAYRGDPRNVQLFAWSAAQSQVRQVGVSETGNRCSSTGISIAGAEHIMRHPDGSLLLVVSTFWLYRLSDLSNITGASCDVAFDPSSGVMEQEPVPTMHTGVVAAADGSRPSTLFYVSDSYLQFSAYGAALLSLSLNEPPAASMRSVVGPVLTTLDASDGFPDNATVWKVMSVAQAPNILLQQSITSDSPVAEPSGVYSIETTSWIDSPTLTRQGCTLRQIDTSSWTIQTLALVPILAAVGQSSFLLIDATGAFRLAAYDRIWALQLPSTPRDSSGELQAAVVAAWVGGASSPQDGVGTDAGFKIIQTAVSTQDGASIFVIETCSIRWVDVTSAMVSTIISIAGCSEPGGKNLNGAAAVNTKDGVLFVPSWVPNTDLMQILCVDIANQTQRVYAGAAGDVCNTVSDGGASEICFGSITALAYHDASQQLFVQDRAWLRVVSAEGFVRTLVGTVPPPNAYWLNGMVTMALGFFDGVGVDVGLPRETQLALLHDQPSVLRMLTWVPATGSIRLIERASQCTAGNYSAGNGSCAPCRLGSYCPVGSYSEAPCSASFYCPDPTQSLLCPPGSYCELGVTAPVMCPAGFWCPAGSAKSTGHPCPAGTYGTSPGLTTASCSDFCPLGHYCPAASTSPTPCPPLTYGNTLGLQSATCTGLCDIPGYECSAGTEKPTSHPCPPGTASDVAPVAACPRCPPGEYTPLAASLSCIECLPPRILSPEQSACLSVTCPAGHYIDTASVRNNTYACAPCALGTYMDVVGSQTKCKSAPMGSYVPRAGAVFSLPCPAVGVLCAEGFPHPQPNYYLYETDDLTGEVAALPCMRGFCNDDLSRVLMGNVTFATQCALGRLQSADNTLCGMCAPGYVVSGTGDACVAECDWQWGIFVLIILTAWAMVLALHVLSQSTSNSAFISIIMYFGQTASVMASNSGYVLFSLDVLNASPQRIFHSSSAASSYCLGPFTAMGQLYFELGMVLVLFILLLLTACTHALLTRSAIGRLNGDRCSDCLSFFSRCVPFDRIAYMRTLTALVLFTFTKLLLLTTRAFHCVSVGDAQVLYFMPAISCRDSMGWAAVVTVLFLLSGLVLPVSLWRHRSLSRLETNGQSDIERRLLDANVSSDGGETLPVAAATNIPLSAWSLPSEPYSAHLWWFVVVVLVRRALLVVINTELVLLPADRFLLFNTLHAVSVGLQMACTPYRTSLENGVEAATLVLLLCLGSLFQAHPATSASDATYRAVLAVSMVLVAVPLTAAAIFLCRRHLPFIRRLLHELNCCRRNAAPAVTESPATASPLKDPASQWCSPLLGADMEMHEMHEERLPHR